MKRVLKLAGVALASVVAFVVVAVAGAVAASEVMIRWPAKSEASKVVAAADAGAVERGRRVAVLNGCHDCHGDRMEGRLFHDEPGVLKAWGPNLSLAAASQSDAQLDVAIRQGIGVDGRPLWVMPSNAFAHLTDAETADLLAYTRSFKPTGEVRPRIQLGAKARLGVLLGKFHSEPKTIAETADVRLPDFGPATAAGRDLARLCVECHGADLTGSAFLKAPDLDVAAAYEREDFARLLKTGVAAGDRELGLMTAVGRSRFHILTEADTAGLHDYLKARAAAR
jgi:mono/diheme cytochrome c family protein